MPSFFVPVSPFGYGGGHYVSGGGGLLTTLLLVGLVGFIAVKAARAFAASRGGAAGYADDEAYGDDVTVCRLQVGLLGVAKELKADLDAIAASANTNSPEGLHLMLQETVLALLRNPQYISYAAASSETVADERDAEALYNSWSVQERSKFAEETFSNVGGVRRAKAMSKLRGEEGTAELVVVTLLVAVEGRSGLPPRVSSLEDVRAALTRIAGVSASQLMAAEILWTPQAEGDYFTRDEIAHDYPALMPV